MRRLGELLIDEGLITIDQCEEALRTQARFGGRLGTNLVELGYLDLDTVTRALAAQHGMAGALSRHFAEVDSELQERLSAKTALLYECIPLVHVFGRKHGVVIASTTPLARGPLVEIGEELLVDPTHMILAIAAEMRINYHLERVYQIVRPPRFLRVKGSIPPFSPAGRVPGNAVPAGSIEEERRRFDRAQRDPAATPVVPPPRSSGHRPR